MLYGIDPTLGPELLGILREMGHGDEIAIVDANFPAASHARKLVRMDGTSATSTLRAVVSLLPLDTFVDCPVCTMQVVDDPQAVPDVVSEFRKIVDRAADERVGIEKLERFEFYRRVAGAFAVVVSGERRLYGNVLLRKGIIPIPNR